MAEERKRKSEEKGRGEERGWEGGGNVGGEKEEMNNPTTHKQTDKRGHMFKRVPSPRVQTTANELEHPRQCRGGGGGEDGEGMSRGNWGKG